MKKAVVMAMAFLLAATAPVYAAGTEFPADPTTGSYTVSHSADITDGNQYVLLVVRDNQPGEVLGEITTDTIMYIDQKAASNGSIVFSGLKPKSAGTGNKVFLGGQGLAAPIYLGTLEPGKGVTVSGRVTYLNEGKNRTASVALKQGTAVIAETTASQKGEFSFGQVSEGMYAVIASAPAHLDYGVKNLVVEGDTIDTIKIDLPAGDVNKDTNINGFDLSMLLSSFGASGVSAENWSDVNGDGNVNGFDISALLNHFGKSAMK